MAFDSPAGCRYVTAMPRHDDRAAGADRLADEALEHLERGDAAGALAAADEALSVSRRHVPALHARAAALSDLGRAEEAREAYEAALARGGDDLELLLDASDFLVRRLQDEESDPEALERGAALARRGAAAARRAGDAAAEAELALLEGTALARLGDAGRALPRIDAALALDPEHVEALAERGEALFELCRLDEARAALLEVVRRDPEDAGAHQTLGLVAERQGDAAEARRRLARAHELDPERFPLPAALPPAEFDRAVEDALAELPEPIRRYLANVAIAVEPFPSDDDLRGAEPPLSPGILGVFRGAPLGHKASPDPWSHFPSSIVLYQRNLERQARDRAELVEEIRVTLLHEVGHFLGLGEEELRELGLD